MIVARKIVKDIRKFGDENQPGESNNPLQAGKNSASLLISLIVLFSVAYGLNYIESSSGLNNPQMEEGETELELVDINNDGNVDILSIGDHGSPSNSHGVMVWFGNGQGSWNVYQNGYFGYGGIAVGDLNNDGLLDVGYGMHHNYSSNDFGDSIMECALGDGSGQNWIPWDDGISIGDPQPYGMFGTDFADIDNDGDLDFGGNSFGADDGIHIFVNHLDGTWHQCFGFIGGNSTNHFLFGDVNNDGFSDFCVGHQFGSIYLGNGAGNFTIADGNLPPGGTGGRKGPSLGDVDNDGDQDLAFCNSNGGVEVWTWQGNNTWTSFSGNLPNTGAYEATQICDMNIDGLMDVCAFGNHTVSVWLGDGAGSWTLASTFYVPYPGDCSAFTVGPDADHNGYPDIALVSDSGDFFVSVNRPRFYKESSIPESLFVFPVSPRGGEKFYSGSVQFIRWTCGVPAGTATIKLELSITGQNGPWILIKDSLPNNCRYQWHIPGNIQGSNNCYIRYTARSGNDSSVAITPNPFVILQAGAINEVRTEQMKNSILEVYPNPSCELVFIRVQTNQNGSKIRIYNSAGRLIRNLFVVNGSGKLIVYWDKRDNNGVPVPSGKYFIRLESREEIIEKKVIITNK